MLKTFIERPVLATVVSIIFVVLGVIGIGSLPVEQYPEIAPPTVRVQTSYPGANAEAVLNSVVVPLEESINGVEGMTYMSSTASNGGSVSIEVFFKQGVDPDIATVNVQNRVSQALSSLPANVRQIGVTVRKQQSGNILFVAYSATNDEYDARFVQNYVDINILPQIKRVTGVGDAFSFGSNTYSMRIWLKPDALAAYGLNPSDVIAALNDQNIEAAPGELGANSEQSFQYTLKYTGLLKSAEEFENIIIRSSNSSVLRIKDVATVELGSQAYNVIIANDSHPSVLVGISQTAGSNASEVIANVKKVLEDSGKMLPEGVVYSLEMDASQFLNESIDKVLRTLIEAFILVFLVVLVFLQNVKSTLIPAIAVPVAIIGTFFFLLLFGFSINLLTLFALVLAIGIVVDDAIVVVEAVHAHMEAGEKDPFKATLSALREIAPAIVSITLVMSAVFIPVSFVGGTSGVFFKQFGITLAIAILISAINALTLSPALSALFLTSHDKPEGQSKNVFNKFNQLFNRAFNLMTRIYEKTLRFLGKKINRWMSLAVVAASLFLFIHLMRTLPSGFVPLEDGGTLMGVITLPPGSSMERTDSIVKQVVKMIDEVPNVRSTTSLSGQSFMNGVGSSYGSVFIKMDPWSERDITTDEVAAILTRKTSSIHNASFLFFATPTIRGFGLTSGIDLRIQDKTGGDIEHFYDVTNTFLAQLREHKEVLVAMTTFDPRFPQKEIHADVAKIKDAGITLNDVMGVLQAYIGSMYVSDINLYGKQYRVMVQAAPEYRSKLEDLNYLQVKMANGTMAPITEFITLKDVTGPQNLTRFNLYTAMNVTILPNSAAGYSSGDVLKVIESTTLPPGYGYEYAGITREEANSGGQTAIIFLLSLIFVYLLLAALYESYIIPLAVIFSLPVGLAGVFIFVYLSGLTGSGVVNNIYVQISLIMLIGLLAKNAILIIEYAVKRRKQGMDILQAAISGAVARLRPILMTSFALIFGLMPLATAHGAGAFGNRSIGISAIGGMFIGTLFGVLVIPVLFIIFQSLQERIGGKKAKQKLLNEKSNSNENRI